MSPVPMRPEVRNIITARHNPDGAGATAAPLFPSSRVRWPTRALNIPGHLGLLAKTTAVLEMKHFYFQLLSESPPSLPHL